MRPGGLVAALSIVVVALGGAGPVSGASPEVLTGLDSVVIVKDPSTTPDFPAGSLMRATCSILVRTVADDGSATELQTCELSEDPVRIPENQGAVPAQTLTLVSGPCAWSSDHAFNTSGEDVKASAAEVVVTPSGRVFAWSSYPAEPLVCTEEAPPVTPAPSPGS